MTKRLILRREELYPVYMEDYSHPHYDMPVSDEFYERYVKAMSEFAEVQDQLEDMLDKQEREEIRND